ncbi:MAG: MarR family transcriptional regulator [Tabrizicola sp.]|nr:MarR family transcriptional regulator [Tabrizicola sp.]
MNGIPSDVTILAWARLVMAERVVLARVEADLKAAGFPPLGWYDVALELRRAERALRPVEIEARLLIAQPNMSRLLDRMTGAGLVTREPCADDKRGHEISLTESGHALLHKMWPVYRASIQRHVGARLSEGETEAFAVALGRLLARD